MELAEEQIREKLATVLPLITEVSPDKENPVQGLGLARRAFVVGYHTALNAKKEDIPNFFIDESPRHKGFMFEGAGMAFCMLDTLSNSEEKYIPLLFSNRPASEAKLCAIGAGWACARLEKEVGWQPAGLPDQWMPALTNGYGFHKGFFDPGSYKKENFIEVDGPYKEDFDIGLGRALWFITEGDVEKVGNVMQELEVLDRPHMWTGLGIACVFNRADEKKEKLMKLAASKESFLIKGFEKAANLKEELSTV